MQYRDLKTVLNQLPIKPSSKETMLNFFSGYQDFDEPAIKTNNGIGYVEWNPLTGGGSLTMAFDNNTTNYSYVNKYGLQESGSYNVFVLKRLLNDEIKLLPKP